MTESNKKNKPRVESPKRQHPETQGQVDSPWQKIRLGVSPAQLAVVAAILLLITTAGAISHGYFANRWDERSGLAEVGAVITGMQHESLPNWDFAEEEEISESVIEMLRTTGHVSLKYKYNEKDGDGQYGERFITVAVFVGSPGRITAHDPQVCYSAIDFEGTGTRRRISFRDADGVQQEFWTMAVSKKNDSNHKLVVSHAWGTTGECTAADYPRIEYLGSPYLYKIQLAMPGGSRPKLDDNLSIEFLKEFLPLLRRTIQQAQPAE